MYQALLSQVEEIETGAPSRDDTPVFNDVLAAIRSFAATIRTAMMRGQKFEESLAEPALGALVGLAAGAELYSSIIEDPFFAAWAELLTAGTWRSCDSFAVQLYVRTGRIYRVPHDELSYLSFGALSYVNTLSMFSNALTRGELSLWPRLLGPIIAPFFGALPAPKLYQYWQLLPREGPEETEAVDWSTLLPHSLSLYWRDIGDEREPFAEDLLRRLKQVRLWLTALNR